MKEISPSQATAQSSMNNCPPISRLETAIQNYAWGSHESIARMQGRAPSAEPEAELWIGAHPMGPSRALAIAGQPALGDWIARDPEQLLGSAQVRRFGDRLPYLVKILAAARPLSIQLHPDAQQAAAGFEREERRGIPADDAARCYRDRSAKVEMLIALGDFEGLCGFRSDSDLEHWLRASGSPRLAGLLAAARSQAKPGERAAHVFVALAELAARPGHGLGAELAAFAARGAAGSREQGWVASLLALHPEDPMIAAPLVMNGVCLSPGQALHVTPGLPHSYLAGTGIEVLTDSDNVVRGGLTPKHVDRPELITLLRRASGPPEIREPEAVSERERRYAGATPEYEVTCIRLCDETTSRPGGLPTVILCQEGEIAVGTGDARESARLAATGAAFVPACHGRFELRGTGTVFAVAPARDVEP